jgi:hypothetical protein
MEQTEPAPSVTSAPADPDDFLSYAVNLPDEIWTFPRDSRSYTEIAIVLDEKSPSPSASAVEGALAVVVMSSTPQIPLVPPRGTKRNLDRGCFT